MITKEINIDELPRELRNLGRMIGRNAVRAMRRTAAFGRQAVLRTSASLGPARPFATGAYEAAWNVRDTKKGAQLYNPLPYAIVIEKGRKPGGKMPPVSAIEKWLRVKGKASGDVRSTAYLIARAIAKNGTKGRHILEKTMPAIQARAKVELSKLVR